MAEDLKEGKGKRLITSNPVRERGAKAESIGNRNRLTVPITITWPYTGTGNRVMTSTP